MVIPLPEYAKIKNNYAICYYGTDDKVIESLLLARILIEKKLPGLKLYIGCLQEKEFLVKTQIVNKPDKAAYTHNLSDQATIEDVEKLLIESNISNT